MSIDCRSVAVLINLLPSVTSLAAFWRDEVTARSTTESPIRATRGMAMTTKPLPRNDRSRHLRRTEPPLIVASTAEPRASLVHDKRPSKHCECVRCTAPLEVYGWAEASGRLQAEQ